MTTFGYTTVGSSDGNFPSDTIIVCKATLIDNADVSKLTLQIRQNGSATLFAKPLIYADASGAPGSLIIEGPETAYAQNDNTLHPCDLLFSSNVSLSPATYWIGFRQGETSSAFFLAYDSPGGSVRALLVADVPYSGAPPNPFGTPDGIDGNLHTIYATYTITGGGGGGSVGDVVVPHRSVSDVRLRR